VNRVAAIRRASAVALVSSAAAFESSPAGAQDVRRTTLAEHTILLSAPEGNLVIFRGPEAVLVAGVQSPALVRAAVREMGERRDRPLYVIAMPADNAVRFADGGWGARGAVTIAHEHLRSRAARQVRAASAMPAAAPAVGFSEVIQVYLPGVSVHAVHQEAGYSDNDVSVHFHSNGILMLGNMFTADGYPAIDTTQGGSFSGLRETVAWFAENFPEDAVIVPARGAAVSGRDLREYAAMLQAVHDRVEPLVRRGRTLEQVTASRPLAGLDARWGRGPVSSRDFLATVYRTLQPAK
jgi:hypothetical protein